MKLSIITINRNNVSGLCRTLESTLGGQPDFGDWEQIVVDGASTDGSFDVLQKWKGDSRLGWHVSEADSGIYNAMNKGASHARGEYLLFLNSGDVLVPNVLASVFSAPLNDDIAYGDLKFMHKDGSVSERTFPNPEEISAAWFLFDYLPHPASFIDRRYFEKTGGYDESFKIIADAKFFLNAVASNSARLRHLPFPISIFDTDGISSNAAFKERLIAEQERMFSEKFGHLTANMALHPSEGRPWILPDVVNAAKKDPKLAHFLLSLSSVVSHLWKVGFFRLLLHGMDVLFSRLHGIGQRLVGRTIK